jgi:hypothetical protein
MRFFATFVLVEMTKNNDATQGIIYMYCIYIGDAYACWENLTARVTLFDLDVDFQTPPDKTRRAA